MGDVGLRPVDHRKPLVELGQRFVGLGAVFGHGLIDPMRIGIDPLGEDTGKIGGPRAKDLAHGLHAPGHFGLGAHHIGHVPLHLGIAGGIKCCLFLALPRRAGLSDQDNDEPEHRDRQSASQGFKDGDGRPADGKEHCFHNVLVI
mgnify:CR=1 FL=1